MFPDPTLRWRPYPSIIDGIERPPYVFDQGFWRGVLYLIVVAPKPSLRTYGIEFHCDFYAGFEEMIYSISDHGDRSSYYDGNGYIKEAQQSALLDTYVRIDPFRRTPRHFLFVGADRCYEALGFSEPIIRCLDSEEQAYAWGPSR